MSNILEYSSKATAMRGIERVGMTDKVRAASMISKLPNGKWAFDQDAVLLALGVSPELDEVDQDLQFNCGHVNCPHCGIHLSNGLSDYDGMVDRYGDKGAYEKQKHEWMCLGCNGEWGDPITPPKGSGGRKEPTRHYTNKSTVDGAVAKSHEIFNANPDARRKDAIQLAVDAGIAFYTARTQYQKWHKGRK